MGRSRSSRRVLGLGLESMGGRPLLQPKLGFTPHIGRVDSAFLKKRNLRSSGLPGLVKGVRRRRNRRKLTRAKQDPGRPAGRAVSFPVMGAFWLRASPQPGCSGGLPAAGRFRGLSRLQSSSSRLRPEIFPARQIGGASFKSKFLFQSLPRLVCRRGVVLASTGAGEGFPAQSPTLK